MFFIQNKNSYLSHLLKNLLFFEIISLLFCNLEDIEMPLQYRLNSGNYLILSDNGIFIFDSNLTSRIDVKIFDSLIYKRHSDSYCTNMAQFLSEDDGYIIALISNTQYLISKNGILLVEYPLNYMYPNSTYPIIPYAHSGKEYYYLIISKVGVKIIFRKYIYDSSSNSISHNSSYYYDTVTSIYGRIACELMYYLNKKVVACFYGNWQTSYLQVFNMDDFTPISGLGGIIEKTGGQYYNSAIMSPERKRAAFATQHLGDLIAYFYNIDSNSFFKVGKVTEKECDYEQIDTNVEYIPEREEFIYYCSTYDKVYLARLSKDNVFESLPKIDLLKGQFCGYNNIINLGYSSKLEKYFIFSDYDCQQLFIIDNIKAQKTIDYPTDEPEILICSHFYNYNRTDCYEKVPDGFYCNNTFLKTIDKCHDDCMTCKEGATNITSNCLTCKNSKYLDLGNCVDECINGYFIDIDNITKCKCSTNITCKYCSYESQKYNLCSSCNTDNGFFPLKNDINNINNLFINCYNNKSISEGYFFNYSSNSYEKCYYTCKKCKEMGDEIDNKCIECMDDYEFKTDFVNNNNCYQKCNKYEFFDSENKYYCVDKCQNNFSKVIEPKRKCIDKCNNDQIYKFEHDNKCYNSCKTLDYKYEYNCFDNIPDGFYMNNTDLKTLDKCHDNCQICNEGPSNNNNNCLNCRGSKYFDLGNCVDECINGYFIDNDNITKCKCSTNNKCKYCSKESQQYNLCKTCNSDKGYYPKINDEKNINNLIINCYNNESISDGYYLNIKTHYYESCYLTCKKCTELGDIHNNKCIECKSGYMLIDNNCYKKCENYYYLNNSNNYTCTENKTCPFNYSKLIKPKNQCIENCIKDNKYIFEFRNYCYEKCPSYTIPSNDNIFICEETKKEPCKMTKDNIDLYNIELSVNDMNPLIRKYAINYIDTNDYVTIYKNEIISIYIYKNESCLEMTTGYAPKIRFGDCYQKLINHYKISGNLIISIININNNPNSKPLTTYGFSHPVSGELLNSSEICSNEEIVIEEDIETIIENIDVKKKNFIYFHSKEGINIFNKSEEIYTNLCYHLKSPNGRDIPLKDRIAIFYPNITLCDKGCQNKGIDLENLKVKCKCPFNDIMNNNIFSSNLYGQNIKDIVSVFNSLNLDVLKCFKDIFIKEYFIRCDGAFIIIVLFLCQIICFLKYFYDGFFGNKKYLFYLNKCYKNYIIQNDNNTINQFPNCPIKKKKKKIKSYKNLLRKNIVGIFSPAENDSQNTQKKIIKNTSSSKLMTNKSKNFLISKSQIYLNKIKSTKKNKNLDIYEGKSSKHNQIKKTSIETEDYIDIKEYLSTSFDENDFDDVMEKDKRNFILFFSEKIKLNQIFINSLCIKDPFKPRSLKILVLFVIIELFFVINALFYSQEYLSELLFIEGKDSFFSFVPRKINHFIYIYTIIGIISYFIEYFFTGGKKIKKLFIRNKKGNINLNEEIWKVLSKMRIQLLSLIICSIFFTIFSFFI